METIREKNRETWNIMIIFSVNIEIVFQLFIVIRL